MDVNKRTLERIFDPTEQLEAPLFQRPYVWQEDRNWQPLWESIQHIAEKRLAGSTVYPHFLGTIVLDQLRRAIGTIPARQIIDGQQRLTTLQLALAALRNICQAAGAEGFAKAEAFQQAFSKLTTNQVPLSDDPDDVFKVYPTNVDRPHFRTVMTATTPDVARGLVETHKYVQALIPRAYLFFHNTFSDWLGSPTDEQFTKRLTILYHVIKDDLNLVVIDLDEKDDPQVIFETLNALGTPLLPADLVKNYLFHSAQQEGGDTKHLYKAYWEAFDTDRGFWREEIAQGRFRRPRLDQFLQHYLTLVTGEEAIATQLFSTFRDYVSHQNNQPAAAHMQHFRAYADVYKSFETYPKESREGEFFYRLNQLDTTTAFPLILEILKRFGHPTQREELLQIFTDLESFFVRRTVCGLTPKNYNRFFVEVIKKLAAADDFSPAAIRAILLEQTAETSRWPDDEEFKSAWLSIPFYKRVVQKRTRMILEALNSELYTDKTEKIYIRETLTIEHLMPQKWEAHWPLLPGFTETQRNHVLQTIGNLTLLTKKLNPSISNASWSTKRPAILAHSALNLNRYFQDVENWDEGAIHSRARILFDTALKIWPRPNAVVVGS